MRFTNSDLKNMIAPLFAEQLLVLLVGIADTLVISYTGEASVSGVSLVNMVNTIFIYLFTALASGGAVIGIVADRLTDHVPVPNMLYLSEEGFDLEFSAQRAISRNRCIHALGLCAIAAQCSLRTGGTWDGSVKNLRYGWSPLYVFDDGSESSELLEQMGAVKIGLTDLTDLQNLPRPAQQMI